MKIAIFSSRKYERSFLEQNPPSILQQQEEEDDSIEFEYIALPLNATTAHLATGCDAVGLDWTIDIEDAKARVGDKVALQGNMDPSMLYAPKPRIEQEVAKILKGFGDGGTGHVFNLGHGILPQTPIKHVSKVLSTVRE